jgi:competence protein ComEA
MNRLLKSVLLASGAAGLMVAWAHARDDSKQTAKQTPSVTSAPPTAGSKTAAQVDINSATEKELASLPKIGAAKANAIVTNRPFRGKDELVSKKILSQNDYEEIKDQLIARQKKTAGDQKK